MRACVRVTNRCTSCAAGVVASSVIVIGETLNAVGVRGETVSVQCLGVGVIKGAYGQYEWYEHISNPVGTKVAYNDGNETTESIHPSQKFAYRSRYSTQGGIHPVWLDILEVQLHDAGLYSCLPLDTRRRMYFHVVVLGE